MATSTIRESATLTRAERAGNMLIQLITPGVGSSGVYTPEVLQAAAETRAFPAGTLMFADHPGETESYDRPERSIRDVAGVLVEDARWDEETQALVAEAKTYSPWTAVLTEMADAIGVSIRAQATIGEADESGRPVVQAITRGVSVDFVTQAGRGGAIREVYESARRRSPLIVRETTVAEASADTRREELRQLLRDAAGARQYVYLIDYDETARTVTYELEDDGTSKTYSQGYTVTNDVATALAGDPIEVRRVVSYVPVTESVPVSPAGQSTTTHESEEDAMPHIEESRLAQLEEADRRVPELQRELDEARSQVSEAHREADRAIAARIIAEADHPFNQLEQRGLLADLPLTEAGRLDVDAFTPAVAEAAAIAAEATGAGQVRGLGTGSQSSGDEDLSEAELDAELARISGRTVKEA